MMIPLVLHTNDIWFTRNTGVPLFNIKYYLDNNITPTKDILEDDFYYRDVSSQGGTIGVKWAILSSSGFSNPSSPGINPDLFGTTNNSNNYYSFSQMATLLTAMIEQSSKPVSLVNNNGNKWNLQNGGVRDYRYIPYLENKDLGCYIPAINKYFKIKISYWGVSDFNGEITYTRTELLDPGASAPVINFNIGRSYPFLFSKTKNDDPFNASYQDRITNDIWFTRLNTGGPLFNIKYYLDNNITPTQSILGSDFGYGGVSPQGGTIGVKWAILSSSGFSNPSAPGINPDLFGTTNNSDNYYSFSQMATLLTAMIESSSKPVSLVSNNDNKWNLQNGSVNNPQNMPYLENKDLGCYIPAINKYFKITISYWGVGGNFSGAIIYTRTELLNPGAPAPVVVDLPDTPIDVSLSNTNIPENSAIGSVVGTLQTFDLDYNNSFTYELVSGEGSDDNSSFRIQNDILYTTTTFNYNTKNSYSIRVKSTDNTKLSVEKPILLHIVLPTAVSFEISGVGNEFRIELKGHSVNGGALSFQIIQQPSFGSLTPFNMNGVYLYRSNNTTPDNFQYVVREGSMTSLHATVGVYKYNQNNLSDIPRSIGPMKFSSVDATETTWMFGGGIISTNYFKQDSSSCTIGIKTFGNPSS
jgi:hypothetical protein